MSLYCGINPEYTFDPCVTGEPGRIIAVAAVRTDAYVRGDQTTLATWNDDIANGRVIIIPKVSGEKPKSTDVKIDGVGLQQSMSVGRDFVANYIHFDVIGNEGFYNTINYSKDFSFWYFTQGKKLWDTGDAVADWDGDYAITNALSSLIQWEVAVTWSAKETGVAYDASGLTSLFIV